MDLTVDSDIYEPNIDDHGDYADYLPSSSKFKNGLRCSCGSRKEHIFDTRQELDTSDICSQRLRHLEDELNNLERYQKNNPEKTEIPNSLQLFCNLNPEALECRKYDL